MMLIRMYIYVGVRIDYVLASCGLEQEFTFADIRNDIMGSDHCPVYADLRDDSCVISNASDSEPSAILAANFDEFSNRQKKLSMYFGAKSTTTTTTTDTSSIIASPPSQPTKSSIGASTTTRPTTIRSKSTTSSSSSPKKRKSSVSSTSGSQKLLKSYFTSSNSDKESTPNPSSQSTPTTTTSDDAIDDVVVEANNDDDIDMEALMAEAKERQDTKASWSSLFTAKPPPKCRVHQEPCKLMVVNKKGPNQGRQFYLCSR